MLTYTYGSSESQLMKPQPFKPTTRHTTLYDPPIDEFSVLFIDVPEQDAEEVHPPVEGPSIVIITKLKNGGGKAKLAWRGGEVEVTREGQTFFVGSGEEVRFAGGFVAYRAFVEVA
jgi:mannose-6-phosphate isomerase